MHRAAFAASARRIQTVAPVASLVGEALRYIRDDFADVVVAGGAEAPLTAITLARSISSRR